MGADGGLSTVYSDDIYLRYNYGIYFSSKNVLIYPELALIRFVI